MKATIKAKGKEISVISRGDENDYISLTDIARYKNPDEPKDVVKNWMRSRIKCLYPVPAKVDFS